MIEPYMLIENRLRSKTHSKKFSDIPENILRNPENT
jgi:hypothetical protein